jgi:nucleoside-diphosphate-sugar epimerase
MKPGDVNITYANIDKANKLFGYQPQTTLNEGLEKFKIWFESEKIINLKSIHLAYNGPSD